MELLNIQGKIVSTLVNNKLDSNNYSVKIDSKLPNGIYMLKTSINESVTTKKISVNN